MLSEDAKIGRLLQEFEQYKLNAPFLSGSPRELYEPMRYILSLGGKSMRPLLLLLAYEAAGGTELQKVAMPAAMAVELFHNFSLMHDDIMDSSPLRRGQPTVHKRWDINTAILSGDAMLVYAYRYIAEAFAPMPTQLPEALDTFSTMATEVCEGQQKDMNFERTWAVDVDAYIEMIRQKTAVLLAAALKIGAIAAGASPHTAEALYNMGELMGIAFQLQDDYLDTFGTSPKVGKRIGGDILQSKKTFLVLDTLQHLRGENVNVFHALFEFDPEGNEEGEAAKIEQIRTMFVETGTDRRLLMLVEDCHAQALAQLEKAEISEAGKESLKNWLQAILKREY